jgi:hypothetical protein
VWRHHSATSPCFLSVCPSIYLFLCLSLCFSCCVLCGLRAVRLECCVAWVLCGSRYCVVFVSTFFLSFCLSICLSVCSVACVLCDLRTVRLAKLRGVC